MKNIFLIGPASVGKSTVGELLAENLGYKFIDIDKEFCSRIALIPDYIKAKSYGEYCQANSDLTKMLLDENPHKTVLATSSGFLVHENSPHVVDRNLELIRNYISILLLPGRDPQKYVDIIVQRQLDRWDDCEAGEEKERFLIRFKKYQQYGNIQIYSNEESPTIVLKIVEELENFK